MKTKKGIKSNFEGWLLIVEDTNEQKKYKTTFTDWKA